MTARYRKVSQKYIGTRYLIRRDATAERLPPGVEYGSTAAMDFIGREDSASVNEVWAAKPRHWITQSSVQNKGMLWFSRLVSEVDADGKELMVRDAVDIPAEVNVLNGVELLSSSCTLHGAMDPELMAVARFRNRPKSGDIVVAWRFNRHTERIETLPSSDIVCESRADRL